MDSQFVQDPEQDLGILRFGLKEWKKVSPYILKDFYVMTPWHDQNDRAGFTSYMFYDNEEERGVILMFRMEACEDDTLTVRVPCAEPGAVYWLTDEDSGETWTAAGEELAHTSFVLPEKRLSRLVWIEKV